MNCDCFGNRWPLWVKRYRLDACQWLTDVRYTPLATVDRDDAVVLAMGEDRN